MIKAQISFDQLENVCIEIHKLRSQPFHDLVYDLV